MSSIYSLGGFTLNTESGVLLHTGQALALGARGVAVLQALVAQAPQFVSKDRIVELAWPGLVVEESNLSVQISAIRRALAVVPGAERWIETLPRRGYRYVGPLQGDTVREAASAPVAPAEVPRTNLPQLLSSFVGRHAEMMEILGLLDQHRLLTLVGTGGVGKTRLALRVADDQLPQYPDGVWLVELAALVDPDLVAQSVASVLGVKEQAGKPLLQSLTDHLRSKHLLLVLDNAEHLLNACARLAEALLQQCPKLHLLVTSRERLGLAGEATYRVPSLALPPDNADLAHIAQAEAVQLFVERVRSLQPKFAVTADNAALVAALCRRLDGIALALELATGRIRSMTVAEVLAHLDERFRVLTGGSRTAPRRQQTLRALIDWSYDLLSPAEQALLRRVSVFSGGWTLEAAEAVCAGDTLQTWEVLDLLTALVDKSLLTVEIRLGATRYGMLETVRQYAADLHSAADKSVYARRHLAHYAHLGDTPSAPRNASEQAQWFTLLESEHDNLRAALDWAALQGGEAALTGLALACGLELFWFQRGYVREGRHYLGTLLEATPDEATEGRARALRIWGTYAYHHGDNAFAQTQLERSLAIYRTLDNDVELATVLQALAVASQRQGNYSASADLLGECLRIVRRTGSQERQSEVLHELGSIYMVQGNHATARQMYEETLALIRQSGNSPKLGTVLLNLGILCAFEGEAAHGRQLIEESLQLFRALAHPMGIAIALRILASACLTLHDFTSAQRHAEDALTLARQHGDQNGVAISLCLLGDVARQTGQPQAGLALLSQGLRLLAEIGHKRMINDAVDIVAYIYLSEGKPQTAVQLWAWSDAQRLAIGAGRQPYQTSSHEGSVAQARSAIADDAMVESLRLQGQAMTQDQVIELTSTGADPYASVQHA